MAKTEVDYVADLIASTAMFQTVTQTATEAAALKYTYIQAVEAVQGEIPRPAAIIYVPKNIVWQRGQGFCPSGTIKWSFEFNIAGTNILEHQSAASAFYEQVRTILGQMNDGQHGPAGRIILDDIVMLDCKRGPRETSRRMGEYYRSDCQAKFGVGR